jgi:hypothetical protein
MFQFETSAKLYNENIVGKRRIFVFIFNKKIDKTIIVLACITY